MSTHGLLPKLTLATFLVHPPCKRVQGWAASNSQRANSSLPNTASVFLHGACRQNVFRARKWLKKAARVNLGDVRPAATFALFIAALILFPPWPNPAVCSHLRNIRRMGSTQLNSSLLSSPCRSKTCFGFLCIKTEIILNCRGKKKKQNNKHNPSSHATRRICISSRISFTPSTYVLQISTVARLSSLPPHSTYLSRGARLK